jgi:hypothetical protein
MKSKELKEVKEPKEANEPEGSRIGPINPFAIGNVFIEAAKKLGWMEEEQVERQRRYYITTKGFAEMEKLGMDLQHVIHYRPMTPSAERGPMRHEQQQPRTEITLSHHLRAQPRQQHFGPRQERPRQHDRHGQHRPPDRHNDRNRR